MKRTSRSLCPGLVCLFLVGGGLVGCSSTTYYDPKKIDKKILDSALELKIASPKLFFRTGEPVVVALEFIGHPEVLEGKKLKNGRFTFLPDVEVFREAEAGLGILLELYDDHGQHLYFRDEDVWYHKVALAGLQEDLGYVHRPLSEGVLETTELKLSEWFDLPPAGYVLRVQYRVNDAASFWHGPVASNELRFKVFP